MNLKYRMTVTALVAVGTFATAGCGNDKTSSAPTSSTPANHPADQTTMAAPPSPVAGNGIDRAFVAAMVPYHQAAVIMSRIDRQRGTSQFVERLARDIMASHGKQISTLRLQDAALAATGAKRGSLGLPGRMNGMKADTATLEAADPFDPVFLRAMLAHHRAAIRSRTSSSPRARIPNSGRSPGRSSEPSGVSSVRWAASSRYARSGERGPPARRAHAIRGLVRRTCPATTTTAACRASPSDGHTQPDATVQDA